MKHPTNWILTASQLSTLLNATQATTDVALGVAIIAFAGLRKSELFQIDWADVSEDEILVRQGKAVSSRRCVFVPANLRHWLNSSKRTDSGPVMSMSPLVWQRLVSKHATNAVIGCASSIVLRRTFAAHHLSLTGDPRVTAAMLGTPVELVRRHLGNPISDPSEVTAYWAIVPGK